MPPGGFLGRGGLLGGALISLETRPRGRRQTCLAREEHKHVGGKEAAWIVPRRKARRGCGRAETREGVMHLPLEGPRPLNKARCHSGLSESRH